jgi:uncharacterized membrane protein YhaH (DUF805 family)
VEFLFGGRLGRLGYFGYSIGSGILIALMIGAVTRAMGANLLYPSQVPAGVIAVFIAGFVLSGIIGFVLTIKRLHDLDLSGWWTPVIMVLHTGLSGASFAIHSEDLRAFALGTQLLIWFILCFWPGTPGANRYGER